MYVPLPARRTEAPHYAYPGHLRPQIAALPRAPGVYVFHGADEGVPLYIGKSVNIRQRVLDHLRTPEEARLLRQTRRIDAVRTAGDLARSCSRRSRSSCASLSTTSGCGAGAHCARSACCGDG
nr:hypothetical protein [Luteimonas saliphila]